MSLLNKIGKGIKNVFTKTVIIEKTVTKEIEHIPCRILQLCKVNTTEHDMVLENLLDNSIIEIKNVKQWKQPNSIIYLRNEKFV